MEVQLRLDFYKGRCVCAWRNAHDLTMLLSKCNRPSTIDPAKGGLGWKSSSKESFCADTLLAVIPPRPPPKHLHSACDSSAGEPGSWDDPARFRCCCKTVHQRVFGALALFSCQMYHRAARHDQAARAVWTLCEVATQCRLPTNASATKKRLAAFLKQRLRIPDVALIILFNVRPWAWAVLAAWLMGAPLASRLEVRDNNLAYM